MGGARPLAALALLAVLGFGGMTGAAYAGGGGGGKPDAHVDATGNPVLGGLAYDPEEVRVAVGDVVEWTNTDLLVPHTATDDHGLWRLAGDFGDPLGLFPKGFGPGESVSRPFDGGTFGYYCEVHGREAQHGVVEVRDRIKPVRRNGRQRLLVTWGNAKLPDGQVFDVQESSTTMGGWRKVRRGTSRLSGTFPFTGQHFFRSRVRDTGKGGEASGWSPAVGIAF